MPKHKDLTTSPNGVTEEVEFITEVAGRINYFEDCLEVYEYIKDLWINAKDLIKIGTPNSIKAGNYAKRELLFIDVTDTDSVNDAEVDLIDENMCMLKVGKPLKHKLSRELFEEGII